MADVTVGEVVSLVKDFCRDDNMVDAKAIRMINAATDIVKVKYGIPSYEKDYSFYFDETTNYYSAPADYGEDINIRFDDDSLNNSPTFVHRPAETLYKKINTPTDKFYWGTNIIDGVYKQVLVGKNSTSSLVIDLFNTNNSTNWTASDDASDIIDDNIVYKEGSASLSFTITPTATERATVTRVIPAANYSQYVDFGTFRMWVYLPTVTDFSSMTFSWGSGLTDYYTQTVTTQADGSAFAIGWNDISFPWYASTPIGNPDSTKIINLVLHLDYASGFIGGTSFRLDYLRLSSPDEMILTYYTKYKGTDSSGASLEDFTALTDKFMFGATAHEFKTLIALYASIMVLPTLLGDNTPFVQIYNDYEKRLGGKYPRKTINNFKSEPLRAN